MAINNQLKIHPIFPSILSTNYFNLESRLTFFQENGIEFIHLDVMDGHFVNNISFGPAAVSNIKSLFHFQVDAHLMVTKPAKMIPWFIESGSEWVSFHIEAEADPGELIALIKKHNRKAGLVLNPDADVERVFPFLDKLDYVLLMSVFPGYGGQKFITATLDRVAGLKKQITAQNSACLIQVDGGINDTNIGALKSAGADLFVVGTFLFNAKNMAQTLENLLDKIK